MVNQASMHGDVQKDAGSKTIDWPVIFSRASIGGCGLEEEGFTTGSSQLDTFEHLEKPKHPKHRKPPATGRTLWFSRRTSFSATPNGALNWKICCAAMPRSWRSSAAPTPCTKRGLLQELRDEPRLCKFVVVSRYWPMDQLDHMYHMYKVADIHMIHMYWILPHFLDIF